MLASRSRNWRRNASSPLAVALTLSFCAQTILIAPAQAFLFIVAKKVQVFTPMESKLSDQSGTSVDTATGDDIQGGLAPLSLQNNANSSSKTDKLESDAGGQYLKLHAETISVKQKGPLDGNGDLKANTLPTKSLKLELEVGKDKFIDKAKNVNVMPLSLQDSDAAVDQKFITENECEKAQISELWEATLNRNPDIQFVVQKLVPSSDKGRTTTMLMRLISSTLCSVAGGVAVVNPSPGGFAATQVATSTIMNIIGSVDSNQRNHASIDEGQAISLYMLVRGTADKVTENYRDYKKFIRKINRAEKSSEKVESLVAEVRSAQDAIKQIESDYLIDKAQGEVEEAVADARRYRQSLIDLAGVEAVNKLDLALKDQLVAEESGTLDKGPVLPGQKARPLSFE